MKIYILRHGETDLNSQGVMQGILDIPLNRNGRELAAVTGRAMKGIRFDGCYTSPLIRAAETAEIILRESGNDIRPVTDARLREINCGDLEGKKLSELGDAGIRFMADPARFPGFPNGETLQDICRRPQSILKELIAKDDGNPYLLSTHGCAMRAMVNYLNDNPDNFWFGSVPYNCSMTIIETENGVPHITDLNKVFYDQSLAVDPRSKYASG